jgi:hypothetical protein
MQRFLARRRLQVAPQDKSGNEEKRGNDNQLHVAIIFYDVDLFKTLAKECFNVVPSIPVYF